MGQKHRREALAKKHQRSVVDDVGVKLADASTGLDYRILRKKAEASKATSAALLGSLAKAYAGDNVRSLKQSVMLSLTEL